MKDLEVVEIGQYKLKYWNGVYSSCNDNSRTVASSFLSSVKFKESYGDNVSNSQYVKQFMSTFSFGTMTKKAKAITSDILMLALKRDMNCL